MSLRIGFNARDLEEPHTRGLTRYTTCLLRELSSRADIELVLFTMNPPHPVHMRGVRARVVAFEGRETQWQEQLLPGRILEERLDLFHAPADRGLPLLRKSCPFVVTVHDSYERANWRAIFPTLKSRGWYWKNEAANRWRADAVLTVSDATRRDLVAARIASARVIHRIYLAAAAEFRPEPEPLDADVVARRGVTRPFILYVGGYDRRKNVDTLVRAFDRANLSSHELVIVASKGGDAGRLADSWRQLSCFARLRLVEAPADELPAFYRGAALFVNPSLWESFSFQLLEAMACGTPLLASDRKAIPEIAGDAAEYCDASDVDSLATAMSTLMTNDARRAELRRKGFERVASFSWPKTADETMKIYRTVIKDRRRSAGKSL